MNAVYPRPRGEYVENLRPFKAVAGLPPPTRGIRAGRPIALRPYRSTPAHAGNTWRPISSAAAGSVYPRPRGEYRISSSSAARYRGLPPPTRGILPRITQCAVLPRSTPAHAGNTLATQSTPRMPSVYPRPRGEYEDSPKASAKLKGLPPPTRGIPPALAQVEVKGRSTPAHAGNTVPYIDMSGAERVYPRPRGEYVRGVALELKHPGLPPPTRGIPHQPRANIGVIWSTPAHAGNTDSSADSASGD